MNSFINKLSQVQSIAFDLDDTLIDTTGILVPMAAQKACQAMIQEGLQTDLQTCVSTRTQLLKKFEAQEIFQELTKKFNKVDIQKISQSGFQVFYNPQVPEHLPLIGNSREVLQQLKQKYRLHLVTAGIPETQQKKVQAAGIEHIFTSIQFVDISKKQNKGEAFQRILDLDNLKAQQLLCVGNRLTDEIYYAEKMQCPSCLFNFGEHQNENLVHPEIHPSFTISDLNELIVDLGL